MTNPPDSVRSLERKARLTRTVSLLGASGAFAMGLLVVAPAAARHSGPPTALTDSEFWEIFTSMSEPGGSFVSENFVSNETSFQVVIPSLQRSLTRGGVYLGVGPEQNFTYIANLKPSMAVIFDIRRQNAMQHLMYKAVFEASPTRAEFVARLFSRPSVGRLSPTLAVAALFDSATMAMPNDSAYRANFDAIVATLTRTHGFALDSDDVASIRHVYDVFYEAGPGVNYGYRPMSPSTLRTSYPTYGMLQAATNGDSVEMAFLASEENYRTVRELQLRNLVIPLVGDFAGPKAIRAVGEYLRKRDMTVTAFYLSNVEQYLFRQGGASDRFYGNVASLPLDSTSTFIRSVPRTGSGPGTMMAFGSGTYVIRANPMGGASFGPGNGTVVGWSVVDSGGVRVMRMIQDSAGQLVFRTIPDSVAATKTADSLRAATAARQDSAMAAALRDVLARDSARRTMLNRMPTLSMVMGGMLSSGLVSMQETLAAFFGGRLTRYEDVIAMTKTSGWK